MGLFNFLGGNKSTHATKSTSKTDVFTTNQNATSNAAPTVVGSNNTQSVQVTDQGAIAAGAGLAAAAIEANDKTGARVVTFATDALDYVARLGEATLEAQDAQRADAREAFAAALDYAKGADTATRDFYAKATRSEASAALETVAKWGGLSVAALSLLIWVTK